jgi:hypothetical protein
MDRSGMTDAERSIEDKVYHWWPGYWRGAIEGVIFGIMLATIFFELVSP